MEARQGAAQAPEAAARLLGKAGKGLLKRPASAVRSAEGLPRCTAPPRRAARPARDSAGRLARAGRGRGTGAREARPRAGQAEDPEVPAARGAGRARPARAGGRRRQPDGARRRRPLHLLPLDRCRRGDRRGRPRSQQPRSPATSLVHREHRCRAVHERRPHVHDLQPVERAARQRPRVLLRPARLLRPKNRLFVWISQYWCAAPDERCTKEGSQTASGSPPPAPRTWSATRSPSRPGPGGT